jgi:hypothetical protein
MDMRLVFVHGINQQGKDPAMLKSMWIEDLEAGIGRPGALCGVDIVMPYYGDILANLADAKTHGVIAQGPNEAINQDLSSFLSEGLAEVAEAEGISNAKIREEQQRAASEVPTVVEEGFPMSRRINAIVSLLERVSPLRGDLALRLFDQAHAYLKQPQVGPIIDEVVRPFLDGGPIVLVTHSLGTVVTFKLLRAMEAAGHAPDTPLYITLGSPLPLSTVQRALGPSFETPANIGRWINVRDPDDIIALNRGLGGPRFSSAIENIGDFRNPGADAHAIPGYLRCKKVALAVAEKIGI